MYDMKVDVWECENPECGERFITRQEWDETAVWCPFCKDEEPPKKVLDGSTIQLAGGEIHESESA